jgi:hypothetical protein
MIGQLCACDMDNFGDVLYPIIFQKMAERHGVASTVIPLGILEGSAPCAGGYAIGSIGKALRPTDKTFPAWLSAVAMSSARMCPRWQTTTPRFLTTPNAPIFSRC